MNPVPQRSADDPQNEQPLSPREQLIRQDLASMSDAERRALEQRRGFFGQAAAGVAAVGLVLSGADDAKAQSTTLDDLTSERTKRDLRESEQLEEQRQQDHVEGIGAVGNIVVGRVWEAAQELLSNFAFREGVGRGLGALHAGLVRGSRQRTTERDLQRLETDALSDDHETPDISLVEAAVARLQTRNKQSLQNARMAQEFYRDLGILLDWITWAATRPIESLNPFQGRLYGRIITAYLQVKSVMNWGERAKVARDRAELDVALVNEQTAGVSARVKTAIATGKQNDTTREKATADARAATEKAAADQRAAQLEAERRAQKLADDNAAHERALELLREQQRGEHEKEERTARREQEQTARVAREQQFLARRGVVVKMSLGDPSDPTLYSNLNIPEAELLALIEKHRNDNIA